MAPWDDPVHHNFVRDSALSGSNAVLHVVTPTPVLPPPPPSARPSWVGEAALNATHRFYNVLQAVLHGGEVEARPSLRYEHTVQPLSGMREPTAYFKPQEQDVPSVHQTIIGRTHKGDADLMYLYCGNTFLIDIFFYLFLYIKRV